MMAGTHPEKHIQAQAIEGLSRDCVEFDSVSTRPCGRGESLRAAIPTTCVRNLSLQKGARLRYWVDTVERVIEIVPARTPEHDIRSSVFDEQSDRMDRVGSVKLQYSNGAYCATIPADGRGELGLTADDQLNVELHTGRQTIRYIPQ